MSKVTNVLKQLLGLVSQLHVTAVATLVAGVIVPIIAGIFGKNFDPAVIAGWLVLAGGVAAALQKIFGGGASPAPPAK
jgi:hypothetical protein